MKIRTVAGLCIGAGVALLQACTSVGSVASKDPAQIVAARAEARWNALISGKVGAAYDYLSPSSKQVVSLEVFQKRVKLKNMWREAKVKDVNCDAEVCNVKVWLKYDIHDIKGLEMDFEESWIKDGDNWWYVQKK